MEPKESYRVELTQQEEKRKVLGRIRNRLGWTRLVVFLVMIAVAYPVFQQQGPWGMVPLAVGIAVLLFLVSRDVNNSEAIRHTELLIQLHREELDILDHQFRSRPDGAALEPTLHPYSNDLDLFGPSSLFQYINRSASEQGQKKLSDELLQAPSSELVASRQEAIRELAPLVEWRLKGQAISRQTKLTFKTQERAGTWIMEKEKYFLQPFWKVLVPVYSIITLVSAVAALIGWIPAGTFTTLFGLYLFTSLVLSRNTIKPYILLSGIVKEISVLQQLVEWMEERTFQSELLKETIAGMQPEGEKAGRQIKELKTILDRFDQRLNLAGLLFFNSFLLWDVRQMMALNAWRNRNRELLANWFAAVAEMEVLQSLSTLHFNHPQWCFPEQSFTFFIGRKRRRTSLLNEKARVNNDFQIRGQGLIALITGSNMAGKSTFLRSLGVNLVLAQMGSVVCATKFIFSPVQLMSSMRIADDLSENTSTFYAELKKLKTIIEAVNRQEKVFILLDEILSGTNSLDRHTGSAALIAQLIRKNAVAVLATHDVELAALENNYPSAIENYHFDVQVEGEELYFDYKLKNGVCTNLNASILMKKIGIEMEGGNV
jgi:hypothetical protein